ncbi:hypothetical protein [Mycobacterium sp. NPDC050441]|uniref:hypothetical protein n=1 Tax=Mycobacterium sp. NPDC050441 TaxID=3155403 RepID=UPI0033EA84B8
MRQSMDVDYNDQRMNKGLARLVDSNTTGKLSDFTSWDWDEVHLFHEYTDREFIEETVGAPVIKSDFFQSKASLLVFEDNGKPVKAIGIPGDYLRGDDHRVTFPVDAMLDPQGGGYLIVTAPAG